MRVLLTGSSGWLGRYLAPLLTENGHEVTGLDVVPGIHTRVIGSVADRALIDRTMGEYGIEAIVHAGALHKPDIARYPRQAFVDVNVTGTLNLLEAAIAAGNDRFLFTSTTSLMVRADVRKGAGTHGAWWMDEDFGPIEPRNIYGITKLAAEQACRLVHREHGIAALILRTGRFFPEDDDTHAVPSGENIKANELLNRRLTVEDAAAAHLAALEAAPAIGCDTFILSAPPPFAREDAEELARDARAVIARHYPDAAELYAAKGWVLPNIIDRVYDPSRAERRLGWRARTDFGSVLAALRDRGALPFAHDPDYTSPIIAQERDACMC
ncbi:NAD-dependent epimerase/dehydratase family protein [Sphingopyxis sp. H115]|uniref:NAD-dependent epimerase/dehydratase family protein n=1 Tax=Sphingopyxis sp. H115 TaxID=1759073 RepID=UPI0007377662|nr:NAD(P)-dependent oxidoreductase [Sphingopyxis sp. H115]KTE03379.1 oxidoreductase [Sphingopyxis sp. H115]